MMNNFNIQKLADNFKIVLGSKSPRRFSLLKETGIQFSRIIPEVDERVGANEKPSEFALRLAVEKAISLQTKLSKGELVIGCDTIVVLNDMILGKPKNEDDAFNILKKLSGKNHVVITAVAIADSQTILTKGFEETKVSFNIVSDEEIRNYIETKEPMDKAGGYGIQGMGAFLVDRIEGNLDNVIGLPLSLLNKFAAEILTEKTDKTKN